MKKRFLLMGGRLWEVVWFPKRFGGITLLTKKKGFFQMDHYPLIASWPAKLTWGSGLPIVA